MKKLLSLLLVLMLTIFLAACGGESEVQQVEGDGSPEEEETNNEEGTDETETEEESEEEAEEETKTATIGDTISFDGLEVTVNEVKTSEGSDFETPENDFYLILDITVNNTTEEAANISTMMQMTLQDADGYSHDVALFTGVKGSLDGEVGPGRENRGEVAFDVEQSDSYEFIFDDPFTTGQAIWEFSVE
ncbi:DUF4352 domain-containing protein [Piscibacillus sp. B03]|uniref:DUF4352 domain-containing protein n=1 Tax=Piscibacillus sp. B03 TaxID=3457430 RepID=UPI003FCD161C